MKRVSIGGQAVLEGVMMKGPDSYALAVRKPDKEIEVKTTEYKSLGERYKVFVMEAIDDEDDGYQMSVFPYFPYSRHSSKESSST